MAKKAFYVVVDEKVTIWRRNIVEVRDCDTLEQAQKKLISRIEDGDNEWNEDAVETEFLFDTEEQMSVEENGGWDTIEVLDDTKKTIWANSKMD